MRRWHIGGGVVLAGLLTVIGCGTGPSELTGKVTLDGKPVESGKITLIPADGKGQTAGGDIKDGAYTVPGVPSGTVKVSLSAPKVVGKKKLYNTPNSPEMAITEEALPERYNVKSTLTVDIKAGRNTKDWELTSK